MTATEARVRAGEPRRRTRQSGAVGWWLKGLSEEECLRRWPHQGANGFYTHERDYLGARSQHPEVRRLAERDRPDRERQRAERRRYRAEQAAYHAEMMAYFERLIAAGEALTPEEQAELDAWEREHVTGDGEFGTGDWPVFVERIGPAPWRAKKGAG